MKGWKKTIIATMVVACIGFIFGGNDASAKTSNIKIDLRGGNTQTRYPAALEKAKKVKIKNSKKSVVNVKYKKNKNKVKRKIVFTAKKKGTATVTVKCTMKNNKVKTYKYKVKVIKSKKVTDLDNAKKAFKIQNQYRKEKGVAALQWSDELYKFCLYRLKSSGFDGHKNLGRDTNAYFGAYTQYKKLLFAENLYRGYLDPESAMKAWKKSPGHYENLLSSSHICGAIARYGNVWCAIFYNGDKSEIDSWRNYKIKGINVRRYDSQKGTYVSNCSIGYYEVGDHWGTLEAATISNVSGKKIYLEIGKTYIIYERKTPDGCEKAQQVTITVTKDGISEVVLTS